MQAAAKTPDTLWLAVVFSCFAAACASEVSYSAPTRPTSPATTTPVSMAPLAPAPGVPSAVTPAPMGAPPIAPNTGSVTAGAGALPTAGPAPSSSPGSTPLPCTVAPVVNQRCGNCHGTVPAFGAPMSLVSYEDFHKPSLTRPELKVHELSRMRIADTARPMPPGEPLPAAELTALGDWLAAGASAGSVAQGSCPPLLPGMPGTTAPATEDPRAGLAPREGETCYEFPNHQGQGEGDTTPYEIRTGEHYHQFYFKAPWPEGVVATRFGAKFDNLAVLHHWLLLSSNKPVSMSGTHENHSGSQLDTDAQLLAGWAVGGSNFEAPPGVGLELPKPGTLVHTQWHFYNRTDAMLKDASVVQVCTAPKSMRPNVASMTWLGSESILLSAGMKQDVSGTCVNNSGAPITIVAFWPHMHNLGRNMRSVIRRRNGMMEEVFNKPFQFDHQYYYDLKPSLVLQPGESITSTCTFANDTDRTVTFGESTDQEMCYQFTVAYPAGALANGAFSLIGVNGTCL